MPIFFRSLVSNKNCTNASSADVCFDWHANPVPPTKMPGTGENCFVRFVVSAHPGCVNIARMTAVKMRRMTNPVFKGCLEKACRLCSYGGERGIRTLGGLAPTTVFETVPFNHSGTSPKAHKNRNPIPHGDRIANGFDAVMQ